MLRVLNSDDVCRALPMSAAIEAMRATFSALAAGRVDMPLRTALEPPGGRSLTLIMPAHIEGADALGAKIVSVVPGNAARGLPRVHGIVVLLDCETGRPAAVLDGHSLTALRTGAASGLATQLLAREGARVAAVIGSGVQARAQLEAICAVRPIERVAVYSRTRRNAERFAKEMAGSRGVPDAVEVAGSAGSAARGADVICVATSSRSPVLSAGDVADGAHVNAIGSFTPEMIELDPGLVARCRVVVDQREAATAEAGELIAAIRAGLISEDELAELGDVVAGVRPARVREDEITLFKSVGLAAQDLYAARAALDRAVEGGLGVEIAF